MAHININLPHGGNIETYAQRWHCKTSDILDLSTGLHPSGAPAWLAAWLQEHAHYIAHYPNQQGEPARSALAHFMGVLPEQVLMIAGAQAAIEILPQALAWTSLAIRQPCYSEPIRAAERAGCAVIACDMLEPWPEEADAIWLTNPHNPCGSVETFPKDRHGVLDESYMPFAQREQLAVIPHVIRLGSLTKTFCIPGLRLGYVIAQADLIQRLQTWLPPWPCTTLGLHLLPKLLKESMLRDDVIVAQNQRLTLLLKHYGWQTRASTASFVLAKPPQRLPDFALQRILVRSFPEWQGLAGWVRLGLPNTEHDWQRLREVLCV